MIAVAFMLSGVLATVASLLLVAQTGAVTNTMGASRVLVAFIRHLFLGGIGSLRGAVLGGFLLGFLTVALASCLPLELRYHRDAFVYTAVIAMLLVRPQGLIVTKCVVTRIMSARRLLPAWPVAGLIIIVSVVSIIIGSVGGDFLHDLVVTDLIYLLLAVGLYTFVGNSGVFSFGHMGFAAVGGYAAGLFVVPVPTKELLFDAMPGFLVNLHAAPFLATLVGGLVAAVFGGLTAVPLMRLGGLAASLATFALLIIVNVVAQNLTSVTNGQSGLTGVPTSNSLYGVLAWVLAGIVVAYLFQLLDARPAAARIA